MNDISTAVSYGLNKLESFVDDYLERTKSDMPDSLEFLIVKQVIDNYSKNADNFDTLDLIEKIMTYCLTISNPID